MKRQKVIEVRSKILIYDWLLKCTRAIYVVYVVDINTSFFRELVNFSLPEVDSLYAKQFIFHKYTELTSKVITRDCADQSKSEIVYI